MYDDAAATGHAGTCIYYTGWAWPWPTLSGHLYCTIRYDTIGEFNVT